VSGGEKRRMKRPHFGGFTFARRGEWKRLKTGG
jgi:hypothetical protein